MVDTFVIVGANLAGGTSAHVLRREGFDGRLVLIGEEPEPPYERPPLSKEYLRGESSFDDALVHSPDFYEAQGIELLLGTRAQRIDPAARVIELAGGEQIDYDKVLIATGGRNRRLQVPGAHLPGIFDLRTREDADRIRAALAPGRRVVVVGMGFIGAEVAASLREMGIEVVAVEPLATPLARVLGDKLGRVIGTLHTDHGVDLLLSDSVTAFEGSTQVERVVTERGRRIDCDVVVVGVGIVPATEVVDGSDVRVDNGIVVDERCRTNVDGVYAAGDVANHFHPLLGAHTRVEHWQNAIKQGEAAAKSMLGRIEPYNEVHWFWSDQYDVNIQYAGFHTGWDEMVVRGNLDARDFIAFLLKDRRIQAAVALNRQRELRRTIPLIKTRTEVDRVALRDEDVDLRTLAAPT